MFSLRGWDALDLLAADLEASAARIGKIASAFSGLGHPMMSLSAFNLESAPLGNSIWPPHLLFWN